MTFITNEPSKNFVHLLNMSFKLTIVNFLITMLALNIRRHIFTVDVEREAKVVCKDY